MQANLKSDRLVERACKFARSEFHSLHPVGVNNSQINPVVSAKIWKRIVLPSSLFSCELWTDLTKKDQYKLEYTQRHFSRIVQGLSKYSPSLSCTSNLGLWSVKGYIDKCRLLFLGRLVRADKNTVHNKVFMFLSSEDVPDKFIVSKTIQKTANEYDLSNSFDVYADCIYNKSLFSKQVVKNVFVEEKTKWKQSLFNPHEMSVYRNIHCKLKPIHLWAIVKEKPGLRKCFNCLIALLSMKTVSKLCTHCK